MGAEQHQRTVPENDVTDLRAELPYSGGFAFCMMEKRRKRMKKESLKRWGLAALPGAVSVLLLYLAEHLPGFADIYRTSVFRPLSRAVSLISGLFPFSLAELLLAFLVIWVIAGLIRCLLRKTSPARFFRHLFTAASMLLFLFTVFCALTESCAMIPDAAICGFVVLHPEAGYPEIRHIGERQYELYKSARGFSPDEARAFLSHLL